MASSSFSIHSPVSYSLYQSPRASFALLPPLTSHPLSPNRLSCFHSRFQSPSTFPKSHAVLARARQERKEETASEEKQNQPTTLEEEYEEVEISWIQEKAENFLQMTGSAVNAVPGPRVGSTSLPWLLAVPIGYLSITFVIAVVKTILKYNSSKAKRRRLVSNNAFLCKSIDAYFPSRRTELDNAQLKKLERKTNYNTQEVLRKYIRYALNDRPFNPDLVADLIHLRKISELEDSEVAEILNEVSRRIVKEKGVVMMDTRGLTEKGVKRKAAVQALFSKLLYLSELDEFCSTTLRSSLKLKEIFGVTDEDANSICIETLSEASDMDSLERMVPPSDAEPEEESD